MSADLTFRIGAELTEIKGALAGLKRDIAGVSQTAKASSGQQAFQGVERGARAAMATVGRLVAGFATLAGAIRLIGAADELNTLNARIKLVTNSTEEYNRAQVALFELAQRTRTSLAETVNLYARIANATKDAGVGQEVLLQVVETVNQAVQLSGASTQAAEAALVQLGQGLASGALRGEELNSVLEQTPALADAIAKGLGKTRGELRQLGQDGKLTAQQVIDSLLKQRDAVASQFAQLPLTVGQAITQLKNSGLQLVGAFDQTRGTTAALAQEIKSLADYLSSDQAIGAVIEFSATWSDAFKQIAQDARDAVRIIEDATADITGSGENLIDIIVRAFRELPVNLRTVVRVVTVTFAGMVDSFVADAKLMKDAFAAIFTDDTVDAAIARRNARVNASLQAVKDSIDAAMGDRERTLADARAVREAADETRRLSRRTRPGGFGRGTFKPQLTDAQKREGEQIRKAELDRDEKLTKDSSHRQLSILQDLYEDATIAAADYFSRRQALELEALDRSIAVERQRAAVGGADKVKALAEIELLERAKGDVQYRIARERQAAERKVNDELTQLRADDLENQGRTADAARLRIEAKFRDLLSRLGKDSEGAKLVQKLIDTGVAKAQFDELRAQAERFIADLERKRASIERRVNSGEITPAQGREEAGSATAAALASLGPINGQVQQLAASIKDPSLIEAANALGDAIARIGEQSVTGLKGAIVDLRVNLDQLQQGFAKAAVGAGVDALTNFFTDLASGTKTAGQAIRDFVRGFAASMAALAARVLATVIVLKALEAYTGIPASTLAALGGVGANVKHAGGMAGTGPTRQVPALVFAGAPRFHSGSGVLGLKSDEIPAILQTGERVQSRAEVAAMRSGAGGGTRIINVIDPNLVQDYLTSPAGERTILNVIERNRGAVRQKLA